MKNITRILLVSFFLLTLSTHAHAAFRMIIASDPQPKRVVGLDKPVDISSGMNIDQSKKMIHHTAKKMVAESNVFGVIINGDLSESGTMDEHDAYINLVANVIKNKGKEYYPGLGNHDIEKPMKKGHVDRIMAWKNHIEKTIRDDLDNVDWKASDGMHYAIQKQGFLFVQLNVSPWYDKDKGDFTMTSPWNFLQQMEAKADRSNLKIVLNFHAYDSGYSELGWSGQETPFKDFLRQSNVVAIFVGHHHDVIGRNSVDPQEFENQHGQYVDIIHSGAMYLGSYLIVDFQSNQIRVTPVVRTDAPYSTHFFDDDSLGAFTITFGEDHSSQPPRPPVSNKCYQSFKNHKKLSKDANLDKGYGHLPYFICDFDSDGAADIIRFVGSLSKPKLGVALRDTSSTTLRYTNYSHTSSEGIDIGHYRVKGIPNPWLEDVNRDGLLDYVRYVGNLSATPWPAVLLATSPNGFDNRNQYLRYDDAKRRWRVTNSQPQPSNRYSLVAYDDRGRYAGRLRAPAGGRGEIPWMGRPRHNRWRSFVRFHQAPGNTREFYIEVVHPSNGNSYGFMRFDPGSGAGKHPRLVTDKSMANAFRFRSVANKPGKSILTTRIPQLGGGTHVLFYQDEWDKFRFKAYNATWQSFVAPRGAYLWRVCRNGDMASDCSPQNIVQPAQVRLVP